MRRWKPWLIRVLLLIVMVVTPLVLLPRNGSAPARKPVIARIDIERKLAPGGTAKWCLRGEPTQACRKRAGK